MAAPAYDPAVPLALTLGVAGLLGARYGLGPATLEKRFVLDARTTLGINAGITLSALTIAYYLTRDLEPSTAPLDAINVCSAVSYLVVASVSTIMMTLAVGRRGVYVLSVTLAVNAISAGGYVLRTFKALPVRYDALGVQISELRYATWFHTMLLMCLLIAHAAGCTVREALDMAVLSTFVIYVGWLGSDEGFLAEGHAPASAASVVPFFGASAAALALLTRLLWAKLSPQGGEAAEDSTLEQLIGDDHKTSVRRLALMIVATWWAFPIIHVLVAAGLVGHHYGEVTTAVCETVAKTLCTLVMMHGRIETLEERERRARSLQNWRLTEQLRAETMFVSYVFHEMRNPYNGIAGHLACIGDALERAGAAAGPDGGRLASDAGARRDVAAHLSNMSQDVASARLCSRHMNDVLNNVLDLRRIEEGAMTLASEAFDVAAVVADVGRMMRPPDEVLIVARVVDEAGRGLPRLDVRGDAVRLRQVLLNLVSNACKHTVSGRIEILATRRGPAPPSVEGGLRRAPSTLELAAEASRRTASGSPSAAVTFEVRDTGCGIDPEHQQTVFAKYVVLEDGSSGVAHAPTEGDHTTARLVQSTGLGLAVAKQLVRLMGADLRLTSPWRDDGPGTRFHFTTVLPAAAAGDVTTIAEEGDRVEDADVEARLPRGLRCLVADDLAFNRNLLRRYLTRMAPFAALDWDVEECATGEDVLARIVRHRERYDLLFLDEHFDTAGGELRGSEVLGKVRAEVAERDRPVLIITSGNCLAEDAAYYEKCGADATMGKPMPNKFDLGRRLLQLLKRKRGDADEPSPPAAPVPKRAKPAPRRSERKRGSEGRADGGPTLRRRS